LIVVESPISVWCLHQAGLVNVVALQGSVLGPRQEELISERLSASAKILIGLDADGAGQKGGEDCLFRLGKRFWVKRLDLSAFGGKPHRIAADRFEQVFVF
jgi:hypothetical protein